MARKIMITCAVTGGGAGTRDKNPAVPVTPEEIAVSALEAHAAGAAIVHIHVRDPESTGRSMELAHYAEVCERIEADGAGVIVNLTTGPGATFIPGDDQCEEFGTFGPWGHPTKKERDYSLAQEKPSLEPEAGN